jgi:hypothetical protein
MTKTELRKSLAVLMGAAAALMTYVALTVPIITMAGPAVLAVGLGAGAYMAWPRGRD